MTVYAFDIETQSLNPDAFVLGCIVSEHGKEWTFFDRTAMHNHIIELINKDRKRGKRAVFYAHNLSYDYVGLKMHFDRNNHEFCKRPFLVNRWELIKEKQTNTAKYIDTMGLYSGRLEEIGRIIGSPKGKTPEWLYLEKYTPKKSELIEAARYCLQDCHVLIKFYKMIKEMQHKDGIHPNYIVTIGQMSIGHFVQHLRRNEKPTEKGSNIGTYWLEDIKGGRIYQTRYRNLIHQAYHGGRNEAFQRGYFNTVTSVDLNSLYPHIAITGTFPDLKSERYINEPASMGVNDAYILSHEGIAQALVTTPKDNTVLPVLPIRVSEAHGHYTAYPASRFDPQTSERILVGVWTMPELRLAVKMGYTIHNIGWALLYEKGKNPFLGFMDTLYEQRIMAKTPFESEYKKQTMNTCIGKLATRRNKQHYNYITVGELQNYLENGWEPIERFSDGTIAVIKDIGFDRKRYYAPILPVYINALGRIKLYETLAQFRNSELLYCDTDSVVAKHGAKGFDKLKYGKAHGQWKKEYEARDCLIYGRKSYRIGNKIALNRVPKRCVDQATFDDGQVTWEDLITVHKDRENAGKKEACTRNLDEQTEKEATREAELERVIIDLATEPTHTQLNIIDKYMEEEDGK